MTIEAVRDISRDECASLNAQLARLHARFNSPQNLEAFAGTMADMLHTGCALYVAGIAYEHAATVQTVDEVAQVLMSTVSEVGLAPAEKLGRDLAPNIKSHMVYELLTKAMSMSPFLAVAADTPQAATPAVA